MFNSCRGKPKSCIRVSRRSRRKKYTDTLLNRNKQFRWDPDGDISRIEYIPRRSTYDEESRSLMYYTADEMALIEHNYEFDFEIDDDDDDGGDAVHTRTAVATAAAVSAASVESAAAAVLLPVEKRRGDHEPNEMNKFVNDDDNNNNNNSNDKRSANLKKVTDHRKRDPDGEISGIEFIPTRNTYDQESRSLMYYTEAEMALMEHNYEFDFDADKYTAEEMALREYDTALDSVLFETSTPTSTPDGGTIRTSNSLSGGGSNPFAMKRSIVIAAATSKKSGVAAAAATVATQAPKKNAATATATAAAAAAAALSSSFPQPRSNTVASAKWNFGSRTTTTTTASTPASFLALAFNVENNNKKRFPQSGRVLTLMTNNNSHNSKVNSDEEQNQHLRLSNNNKNESTNLENPPPSHSSASASATASASDSTSVLSRSSASVPVSTSASDPGAGTGSAIGGVHTNRSDSDSVNNNNSKKRPSSSQDDNDNYNDKKSTQTRTQKMNNAGKSDDDSDSDTARRDSSASGTDIEQIDKGRSRNDSTTKNISNSASFLLSEVGATTKKTDRRAREQPKDSQRTLLLGKGRSPNKGNSSDKENQHPYSSHNNKRPSSSHSSASASASASVSASASTSAPTSATTSVSLRSPVATPSITTTESTCPTSSKTSAVPSPFLVSSSSSSQPNTKCRHRCTDDADDNRKKRKLSPKWCQEEDEQQGFLYDTNEHDMIDANQKTITESSLSLSISTTSTDATSRLSVNSQTNLRPPDSGSVAIAVSNKGSNSTIAVDNISAAAGKDQNIVPSQLHARRTINRSFNNNNKSEDPRSKDEDGNAYNNNNDDDDDTIAVISQKGANTGSTLSLQLSNTATNTGTNSDGGKNMLASVKNSGSSASGSSNSESSNSTNNGNSDKENQHPFSSHNNGDSSANMNNARSHSSVSASASALLFSRSSASASVPTSASVSIPKTEAEIGSALGQVSVLPIRRTNTNRSDSNSNNSNNNKTKQQKKKKRPLPSAHDSESSISSSGGDNNNNIISKKRPCIDKDVLNLSKSDDGQKKAPESVVLLHESNLANDDRNEEGKATSARKIAEPPTAGATSTPETLRTGISAEGASSNVDANATLLDHSNAKDNSNDNDNHDDDAVTEDTDSNLSLQPSNADTNTGTDSDRDKNMLSSVQSSKSSASGSSSNSSSKSSSNKRQRTNDDGRRPRADNTTTKTILIDQFVDINQKVPTPSPVTKQKSSNNVTSVRNIAKTSVAGTTSTAKTLCNTNHMLSKMGQNLNNHGTTHDQVNEKRNSSTSEGDKSSTDSSAGPSDVHLPKSSSTPSLSNVPLRDKLTVIFPIIDILCGSLDYLKINILDTGGFRNDCSDKKKAVEALGGFIASIDPKWKWTKKIMEKKKKGKDDSGKFLEFFKNKKEIRDIVDTILDLLETTTYGRKKVLSDKLKLKLDDRIIDTITDATIRSLTASLCSSDPPTTDRDGKSLAPSTISTDRSMSPRSAESLIPCKDQRILTGTLSSSSDLFANALEFETNDDNDDDFDNDDVGNNTNNTIDGNDNDNDVISDNGNVTHNKNHNGVTFASNNLVERQNNTGSDGNPKEGGCYCDSLECEKISLQVDKATDPAQLEKIAAVVVKPAKFAEQKALEVAKQVAKQSNSKSDEKEEREKITGNHGSYKGDFDDQKSGHGVYCEDKPRNGNLGIFQSTGQYKNGLETGHCVLYHKDDVESTYRGEVERGTRKGYGVLTYKENNIEYRHEGMWENGRRHGFVLFLIDGSFRSFGLYKNNEAIGTHVTWDSNNENRCGDNDGDNNSDGNEVTLNNNITNDNNDQNKVLTAPRRKKRVGYTRYRGAALQAYIERQNNRGIGAKNTADTTGKCVDRVLARILVYYMVKDETYPIYKFKSNTIDGPHTRSKGSDHIEVRGLEDRLAKELKDGRNVDGWTEQGFWRDCIEQWGLKAQFIPQYGKHGGKSPVMTLRRREPIFIVVELVVKPEYGGPKFDEKTNRPNYTMIHAMVLFPGSKRGTSKLIDPDGMEYTLSVDEVEYFTDTSHEDFNAKKEAKKIFNHCLGIEFLYRIVSSFLIKDTREGE